MVDYFNIQRIHPTANEGVPGVEKKQVGIQKRDIVAGKPMTRVARQEKREKDIRNATNKKTLNQPTTLPKARKEILSTL